MGGAGSAEGRGRDPGGGIQACANPPWSILFQMVAGKSLPKPPYSNITCNCSVVDFLSYASRDSSLKEGVFLSKNRYLQTGGDAVYSIT